MRHHHSGGHSGGDQRVQRVQKSAKQLTSYAGYDIVHNESGTSVLSKTRISKKGNRYMRHHMHMPALSASKHIPEFKALKKSALRPKRGYR
ncbi:MAG: IS110 family transposase [Flavobacteriales bacterium]|nr:IS110 family transposase [Flavobacteriales bacterium]